VFFSRIHLVVGLARTGRANVFLKMPTDCLSLQRQDFFLILGVQSSAEDLGPCSRLSTGLELSVFANGFDHLLNGRDDIIGSF